MTFHTWNANLVELKAQAQALEDAGSKLWNWYAMSPQEAADAAPILMEWARDVLAYQLEGFGGRVLGPTPNNGAGSGGWYRIPSCWYQHPIGRQLVGNLCQEWIRVHALGQGTPYQSIEWHTRMLPEAGRTLMAALSGCRSGHQDHRRGDFPPEEEVLRFLAPGT